MKSLSELLEDQIKDLYSAEQQLVKALPKVIKRATTPELKEAVASHLEETRGHVTRLEQCARELGFKPGGKTCLAMKGLVEECAEVLEEDGDDSVIDAAIVAGAQKVEHYEVSAYGSAKTLAQHLGHDNVFQLLEETQDEESAADEKLTEVVEKSIYPNAPGDEEEPELVESGKPKARGSNGRRGSK